MKILHVLQHMKVGGAQKMLVNLLSELVDIEHIVASTHNEYRDQLQMAAIAFVDLHQHNLMRVLAQEKPDLLHYVWWPGLTMLPKKRRFGFSPAVVVSIVDPSPVPDIGADMYVSDSVCAFGFQSHISPTRQCIVHCYINTSEFNLGRQPHKGIVIGRHSTLYRANTPSELVRFMASLEIPEVRCLIVGDGDPDLIQELQEEIDAVDGRARIELWPGSRIPDMLRICDIFLYMTRQQSPASFANVISEAMAAGIPVVAEDQCGNKEQVVHGVTGFLYHNDLEARYYCESLARDEKLRERMGASARALGMTYDHTIMAQSYRKVFTKFS